MRSSRASAVAILMIVMVFLLLLVAELGIIGVRLAASESESIAYETITKGVQAPTTIGFVATPPVRPHNPSSGSDRIADR